MIFIYIRGDMIKPQLMFLDNGTNNYESILSACAA